MSGFCFPSFSFAYSRYSSVQYSSFRIMQAHEVQRLTETEMTVDRSVTTSKLRISGAMAANDTQVNTTIVAPFFM